jgi:hypothetical protein
MSDRRAHPRLHLPFAATWESASECAEVRGVNISLSGCFLDGPPPPAPGELLTLTIRIPGAAALSLKGWVVYHDPGLEGFAIRFVDVDEDLQSLLAYQLMAHGLDDPWGGGDPGY